MKLLLLVVLIHITAGYKNPCNPDMCDPDQGNLHRQLELAGLHTVSDLGWVRESWFRGKGSAMYLTEAMSWKAMILGYSIFSGPSNSICQTACKPRGGNAYCEGRGSTTQWCTVPFHGQLGDPLWWFGNLYDGRAWGRIRANYNSWQWSLHHMCSSETLKNVKQITTNRRPKATICFLGNPDPMSMRDDGWYNPTAADQEDEKEWAKLRPYQSKLIQKWFNWAGYSDEEISRLTRERPMEPHPGMVEEDDDDEGPDFQCFNDYYNNFTCRWRVPKDSSVTPGTQCTLNITVTKLSDFKSSAPMPPDSGHPHRRTASIQFTSKLGIVTSKSRIRESVYCADRTEPEVDIQEKGETSAVKPLPPKNLTVVWVEDGVDVSWVGDNLRPYFSKEFEVQYKNVLDDWEKAKSAVLSEYSFELSKDHTQIGQQYGLRVRVRYVRTSTGDNLWSDWSGEARWIAGQGRRRRGVGCSTGRYSSLRQRVPRCERCTDQCSESKNEIEVTPCTQNSNRVCACKPGYYCTKGNNYETHCHKPCVPCGKGTFSSDPSLDACKPHKKCVKSSNPIPLKFLLTRIPLKCLKFLLSTHTGVRKRSFMVLQHKTRCVCPMDRLMAR
ncbi:protein ORF129A [Cyprinid herpesvirus 1]|uniref:Protein ORF129A n=1 Tax=Cyprinid herpesvirus 1 TaxID=317858 RepID=K7PCL6_9VIRU|nr:protein ORF129A [Cyprinid herpesvirus 1]AFJ20420.1 protein ORF129A [Cyprinid herpesvirus 1]